MKSFILLVLLTIFSSFTQAEGTTPVPKKIISITAQKDTQVLAIYWKNASYRTVYTAKKFMDEFCTNNPGFFKKTGCSEVAFRHLPVKKEWIFPNLPKANADKSIAWMYKNNEIYRLLFKNLKTFKQEVCKNNPQTQPCTKFTKTVAIQTITERPNTYLIPGETADTVNIDGKKFEKQKGKNYYHFVRHKTEPKNDAQHKKITFINNALLNLGNAFYTKNGEIDTAWGNWPLNNTLGTYTVVFPKKEERR